MTQSQVEVVFQQLLGLGCRPPKQLSTPQGMAFAVQCWARALVGIDLAQFEVAVLRYSRSAESKWWPTPGVLIALIEQAETNLEDNADEMWGKLVQACARYGRYMPPGESWELHDDESIKQKMEAGLQACGGWVALCRSNHNETISNRAAFRGAYNGKSELLKTQREVISANNLLLSEGKKAIPETDQTKER